MGSFRQHSKMQKVENFQEIHAQLRTSGVVSNDLVVNRVAEFFAKGPNFADYACDFLSQSDWNPFLLIHWFLVMLFVIGPRLHFWFIEG